MHTVNTIWFDGTIDHFRALMNRIIRQHGAEWVDPESSQRLILREVRHTRQELIAVDPDASAGTWFRRGGKSFLRFPSPRHYRTVDVTSKNCGSWGIYTEAGHGGIEATEEGAGITRVDFLDAYHPRTPRGQLPIGAAFERFCQLIVEEVERARAAASDLPGVTDSIDVSIQNPDLTDGNRALMQREHRLAGLRPDARARYTQIMSFWDENPGWTEGKIANLFNVSKKTVQRARQRWCGD